LLGQQLKGANCFVEVIEGSQSEIDCLQLSVLDVGSGRLSHRDVVSTPGVTGREVVNSEVSKGEVKQDLPGGSAIRGL